MSGNDDKDILARAKALKESLSGESDPDGKKNKSGAETYLRSRRLFKNVAGMWAISKTYLGPLGAFLSWSGSHFSRWFMKWFRLAAYTDNDAAGGGKTISKKRFMYTFPISILCILALHVVWSGIYYFSTGFTETVYVTGKGEIETGELYQFGGCIALPCSTKSETGKFYLIEASPYFPIMFYPEEDVFANIPQQNGACDIKGYGIYFRRFRWIYKSLQLYQHVTDVSCRPYNADEIRKSSEFAE